MYYRSDAQTDAPEWEVCVMQCLMGNMASTPSSGQTKQHALRQVPLVWTGRGAECAASRQSNTNRDVSDICGGILLIYSAFAGSQRPVKEALCQREPFRSQPAVVTAAFFSLVGFYSDQGFQRWPESHGSSSRLKEQREERRRRIEWIGLGLISCSSLRCTDRGTYRPFESPDTWSVRGAQPAAGRQLRQVGGGECQEREQEDLVQINK